MRKAKFADGLGTITGSLFDGLGSSGEELTIQLRSIQSAETFGQAELFQSLKPISLSEEIFGQTELYLRLQTLSVISAEALGRPKLVFEEAPATLPIVYRASAGGGGGGGGSFQRTYLFLQPEITFNVSVNGQRVQKSFRIEPEGNNTNIVSFLLESSLKVSGRVLKNKEIGIEVNML